MALNQDPNAVWGPQGYLRLANVMAKHPQLAIFRRFDMCTNVSILSLQAELLSVQQEFLNLCEKCDVSKAGEEKWYTSDFYELAESDGVVGLELKESLKQLRKISKKYSMKYALLCEVRLIGYNRCSSASSSANMAARFAFSGVSHSIAEMAES